MVTLIGSEPEYITAGRRVVFKAMCVIPVTVFTHAAGLIEIIFFENVAKHHACLMRKGIMDAYSDRPLYITVGNFGKIDTQLPKN